MTLEPDVLKDGLATLAAAADEVRISTGEVRRRARRRRGARLAGTAASGAAVAVAATLLWPGGPGGQDARILASPMAGRPVSYHGVQLTVPAGWGVNALVCNVPTRDTLVYPGIRPDCMRLTQPKDVHDTVEFTSPTAVQISPGRTISFGGYSAVTGEKRLADGRTEEVLVVPALQAAVVAKTRDPQLARTIISGARFAKTDAAGCAAQITGLTPTASARVTSPGLVPGGFTTATVCAYEDLWMSRSTPLAQADAQRLAALFNGLPAGLQRSKQACTPYDDGSYRSGYLVRFRYPSGDVVEVGTRTGGCKDVGATNGKVTGHLTQPLIDALGRLSGDYLTGIPLEDLR